MTERDDNEKPDESVPTAETAEMTEASASEASPPRKPLTPAAQRALVEAEERRRKAAAERQAAAGKSVKELGGRGGPDPIRYGDWENDGIISDF